jgi:hypothetical protein
MAETITIRTGSATDVIKVIAEGPQGPAGSNGANGQGVPVGGTTGQVLRKASGTNYDTEWAAAASGSGSVTSVALAGTGLSISGSPVTTSGTITANVVYGTTAGTAAEGNDSRFVTASTTTPAALGTAAVGTGTTFARADHVHAMPTAANVGAAQAVTDIELTRDGTTTITTAQLPARGIAFSDGETTFTVNLPTPDIRQSGLTFSIKSEYEAESGPNFITVVHDSVNLLTTYELDEAEGSIDFLWDGYAWTYSSAYRLRSFPDRVLQLPAGSGTLALTSNVTKTYATFTATDNQPPSTAFATLDTRGTGIAVLDFDDASTESAVFVGVIPEAASLGSGLIVSLRWMATTATSGDVRWSVAWEKSNTDLDSDSYDSATASNATTNGTNGIVTVTNITCTTIDSLAAGDLFRLRVQRIGGDNADTMTGDAELVAVEVRSAA